MAQLSLTHRLKRAFNVFRTKEEEPYSYNNVIGTGYRYKPDRTRFSRGNEHSIITSVYNTIALDSAAIDIRHVRLDGEGRFSGFILSGLDNCLTTEANIDQTGRAFIQDAVMSLLDEGVVALFPVDTDYEINKTKAEGIGTMRVAKILEWYPAHVKVRAYDDRDGVRKDVTVPKDSVAIIENPMWAVINEPSSTMKRLVHKLNLLDAIDEQSGSGRLDMIIQLPYVIKSDLKREQAEKRRQAIEDQLNNSKYGVAYTDGTEKVIQLNRGVDNNLMKQIEYLTSMLFSQLGITQSIMDGTADEDTMTNYYNRTVEPILSAIVDELKRKFLSKTARSQGQSVEFFRDPFRLVPLSKLAELADKFTRNEILTSNEFRQIIGRRPSSDPNADELRNKNLPKVVDEEPAASSTTKKEEEANGNTPTV